MNLRAIGAAGFVLSGLGGCSSSGGANAAAGAHAVPASCQAGRPATAFTAGPTGATAGGTPAGNAPIPCLSLTGYGASESTIGFAHDGTVFFAPASAPSGNGVVRSRDDGATWDLLVPTFPGGGHTRLEPFMWVDPATDHVLFATSKLVLNGIASFVDRPGIHLTVSTDQGDTWSYVDMAPQSRDWVKIFSGPAPGGAPNVVYFSSPSPIAGNWAGIFPPPDKQYVYRSVDGGLTWQGAGTLPLDPSMIADCTSTDYVMFGQGAVAPDGTAYLGYRLCTHLAVAVSRDEGATWATREIPMATLPPYDATNPLSILGNEDAITGEPIAVDSAGNLYAVWNDVNHAVHLSTSKDGGATWSAPVVAMDPVVTSARFAAVGVRAPGEIAIAYFGSADDKVFHGYISETANAFDAAPVFWSAAVNDPSDPLYANGFASGYDGSYFSNGGDGIEFVQVRYAPSGDVWASFVKDMCPRGTDRCAWDYAGHANSRFQGAAGRLLRR
jgi:hypothetical protein